MGHELVGHSPALDHVQDVFAHIFVLGALPGLLGVAGEQRLDDDVQKLIAGQLQCRPALGGLDEFPISKNATDSALITDATDMLHAGDVDGFCLVSSDSDFTRLATRIRVGSHNCSA